MMREYEAFLEIRVLSYVIMDNHFHLLLEVPPKKKGATVEMSDEAFLAKVQSFYSKTHYLGVVQMLEQFRKTDLDVSAEELKAKYTHRMHDLSVFMQCLKMRFTQWFNKTHQRTGTLWEGRFKSILVQDGYASRVIAAYIDLNPIRACMVEKPEDYAWSSYGEAMKPIADAGRAVARAGICHVLQKNKETSCRVPKNLTAMTWNNGAAEQYRMMLFADGAETFVDSPSTGEIYQKIRKGFKRKDVAKVLSHGGKLTFGESLRCRVRYLSDGLTFGSKDFVDHIFEMSRDRFGKKRKSGARPIRGVDWKNQKSRLYTMRQLRKDPLS